MTITELLPTLRALNREDKLRAMQFLEQELAQEEEALLTANQEYPVWSPYDAYEAAETLLAVLNAENSADGKR